MDRQQAKELLPIIQAFAEGKIIQSRRINGMWIDLEMKTALNIISLINEPQKYRIKPEPKYRPFKDAEECWCEMLKHEPFGWVIRNDYHVNIANLIRQSITFADNEGRNSSFSELLEDCTFVDGKKFGIKDD